MCLLLRSGSPEHFHSGGLGGDGINMQVHGAKQWFFIPPDRPSTVSVLTGRWQGWGPWLVLTVAHCRAGWSNVAVYDELGADTPSYKYTPERHSQHWLGSLKVGEP